MDRPDLERLHHALKTRNFEQLDLLLKEGIDIYATDNEGKTALHILVAKRIQILTALHRRHISYSEQSLIKNESLINMLLKHISSHDHESANKIQLLTFHAACMLKRCCTAAKFLEKIVDVNQPLSENSPIFPGYTALHFAAHSNIVIMKMLIAKGANMLAQDTTGVTPLDICLSWLEVQDLHSVLIEVPAWKNILFSNGETKLMDFLYSLQSYDHYSKLLGMVDKAAQLSLPKESPLWPGYTILHLAVTLAGASHDNVSARILDNILSRGADVTAADSHGSTPIHLAYRQHKSKMLPSLVQYHKKLLNPLDKDNLSHLHIACAVNDMPLVKRLLTIEANIDIAYKGVPLAEVKPGWTPLHTASFTGRIDAIDMLLDRGANFMQTDSQGFTAIHRLFGTSAITNKICELMSASKQLKDCVVDGIGLTHLHVMVSWNKENRVIERLLSRGADIEATIAYTEEKRLKNFVGFRPLHLALTNNLHAVKMLLNRGADVFAMTPDGSFPLYEVLTCKYKKPFVEMFVSFLWKHKELQKRMEEEMGLTMLHVACYALDYNKVKKLLKEGADVNVKTCDTSIWPGFTPLHVLTFFRVSIDHRRHVKVMQLEANKLVDLLLDNKADVTMTNLAGDTPLHSILKSRNIEQRRCQAGFLVAYHQDFNVNPTSKEGLSHFHIACLACDKTIVEKFLKHGVDINQSVNESASAFAGNSALHFILEWKGASAKLQVELVDLLLKYGVNVNAVNAKGWTPVHYVATFVTQGRIRKSLLDRFVSNGADINKQAHDGKTPFELLLQHCANDKGLNYFMENGSRANTFNCVSGKGYMGMVLSELKYFSDESNQWLKIVELMMSSPDITEIDVEGRNAIHNAVAGNHNGLNEDQFADLIEKLIKLGCDLHQQDRSGKTALHLAVKFYDGVAVRALLKCGSDINFVDSEGRSPFSYCKQIGINYDLSLVLIAHIICLRKARLDVSRLNIRLLTEVCKRIDDRDLSKTNANLTIFCNKKNETRNVQIGQRGLTLYDLVFENDVSKIISRFRRAELYIISKYLESIDYKKFRPLKYMLKLQYRKVMETLPLISPAARSLDILLEHSLPHLCVEVIVKFLNKVDLERLISATVESEDVVTEMITD